MTSFYQHVHKPSRVLIVHLLLIGELRNSFSTSLWKLWNIIKTSADLNALFQRWLEESREGRRGGTVEKRGWESGGHTGALSELGLCCPPWLYVNIYMWNRSMKSLQPAWTFGSLCSARVQIRVQGRVYRKSWSSRCLPGHSNKYRNAISTCSLCQTDASCVKGWMILNADLGFRTFATVFLFHSWVIDRIVCLVRMWKLKQITTACDCWHVPISLHHAPVKS